MKKFIQYFLKDQKRRYAVLFALTLLTGFLEGTGFLLLLPLLSLSVVGANASQGFLSKITDYLSSTLGLQSLERILVIYVILILAIGWVKYIQSILIQKLRFDAEHRLRTSLFESFLRAEYAHLTSQRNADLSQMLSQEVIRISLGVLLILQVSISITLATFYLAGSFFISSKAMLVFTGLILTAAVIVGKLRENPMRMGDFVRKSMNEFHELLLQYIEGLKPIKISRLENRYDSQFKAVSQNLYDLEIEFSKGQARAKLAYEAFAALIFSVGFYVLYRFLNTPLVTLILCLVVCARIVPQLIGIHQKIRQFQYLLPSFESAMKLLDKTGAHREITSTKKTPTLLFKSTIAIQNISFRYPSNSQTFLLDQISLLIPFGSLVGISGESGAGKTTLVDILAGLLSSHSGCIKIDGAPLTEMNRLQWRSQVSYLNQDPFLFSGSIRENLLWGSPHLTEAHLWEALAKAQAEDFVRNFPEGLNTMIANNGGNLSGGQRQRIALARAFLKRPSLLILDEVTSQLDETNQRAIQKVLSSLKGEMTTIIVSHNKRFIENADQLVVLRNGKALCEEVTLTQHSA